MMYIDSGVGASWWDIGSAKPDKIEDEHHSRTTLWIRSKLIAMFLREFLKLTQGDKRTGLIISMEYPTPTNDFLVALNRIIHVVLFDDKSLESKFGEVRILTTNASTLRSLMGLKQRGAKNKQENILKAYEYVDNQTYPELDSDACDAVLMAVMGRYAATIMLGKSDQIPPRFLTSLCNATEEIKGKGRNARTVIKGILHRPEYWYTYELRSYGIGIKDASNPKKALQRKYFLI
jgi:hypothetical protein